MSEREGKIIAFDGLSLSGKSTMVAMSNERVNAEIVRENTFDPHRATTSRLNKLLKDAASFQAVKQTSGEFPSSRTILSRAMDYAFQFEGLPQRQALLAYMFTAGRKVVDEHVREVVEKNDVILDRWQVTGWAYQVEPGGYTWQNIMELNQEFGIVLPDVQIILTCPIDQIQKRKAYREKQQVGTAGQMSSGREHIILSAFTEIYDHLKLRSQVYMFENSGVPTPDVRDQVMQAVPTFKNIERLLRENGFSMKEDEIRDIESYWLDSERVARIEEKQTK